MEGGKPKFEFSHSADGEPKGLTGESFGLYREILLALQENRLGATGESATVPALMSAGGQHGCWFAAALPLPSGTCETRGTRGTFSSFELA